MSSDINPSPPPPTMDFSNPPNYTFPTHRLARFLRNPDKQPVVLVACGSFSPVTYLHLRMFEMAKDYVRQNTDWEIVGGYLSPVSDQYKKPGLLNAQHRVTMCNLAADLTSTWLMVDPWEAFQSYQRTAVVLDHFDYEINTRLGGIPLADGSLTKKPARIMLLAGSDLIATMSEPGVWSEPDLDHILGRYGVLIIERAGADMDQAIDALSRWRHNIHLIHQLVQNDVSSTKVRLFLRRGLSVRYLLPSPVVDYIEQHGLYMDDGPTASAAAGAVQSEKEKGKEKEGADSSSNAAC
ncbi:Nucleotidylyl transferase [Dichomitus squalens]|uniref:Nicotinamide-nucleotide adenylyltransferase n=2 Tax=Dichomitus squalens TaxID=114155 RepID=A0A4Q9PJ51_9APHY|nr:Nucleotidylyl transferase [Dichomitus squalens LYAD-421 SS1]EJF57257.1 Nucleotidylyl transferase [Dichomitus squalens LYAD-421 SS1]TBU31925.1 Nucleotidylyl transferase [Dichomitus squalens]TBU40312.1 Nucleotidylyl transferase [Dichomitus squalens]TBU54102.1 Nucleotidylyl transferase [Dichomitus squalens]